VSKVAIGSDENGSPVWIVLICRRNA